MEASDKEWARKYILDPLTAPEPSQETGPGASHSNHRGSLTYTTANPQSQHSRSSSRSQRSSKSQNKHRSIAKEPFAADSASSRGYPTPPSSASPTHNSFRASNPFSDAPPPYTPQRSSPSASGSINRKPVNTLSPPRAERQRSASTGTPSRPSHSHLPSHTRERSLSQRFPGDMSHRPLDIIKRETRAADRLPKGHRKQASDTDIIDALDTIAGAPYHHGGPYDATLASRNVNKNYSPVAAVQDSNMEAIRATPREYVQDSLTKHVPLQGTANVPPGTADMSGRVMNYQEGADLMREADAPGGAYKRWDGIQYHPDDLKGKSEPSYTYEEDLKKKKGKQGDYELQPGLLYPTRQRSSSHNAENARATTHSGADGVQRSHSVGKHIGGLKKRLGGLGKKKSDEDQV